MDITIEPPDELHWRVYRADKAREERPTRPDPVWVAKEIVYWCTQTNPRNAYFVLLQLPLVGDVVAVSPSRGNRVVRLLYQWSAIEPHLSLDTKRLTEDVLATLCSAGGILRAGLAYAAKFQP